MDIEATTKFVGKIKLFIILIAEVKARSST